MKTKKSVYDVITERIIEKLEQGVIPWSKSWSGRFQPGMSLISRKPYRGINFFTTIMMGWASPYWLTFKQAKELGGHVKKGEKGLPILFWNWKEVPDENDKTKVNKIAFARYYTVFNVEQIEGLPFSEQELFPGLEKYDFQPIDKAQQIVDAMPMQPNIEHKYNRASYGRESDIVNMPKPEHFAKSEEYYSTLFHELTHATGHEKRLNRKSLQAINKFGDHSYSKEELVAEMGAAYLCGISGISQPTIEAQAAYIQEWTSVLKGDSKLVVQAAAQAQKAADFILNTTFDDKK